MQPIKLPNYDQASLPFKFTLAPLGGVISNVLAYVYVFAGLGLLIMLILGGLELMTAGGDPGKSKAGYGKVTAGLIGFLIVFVSYFVVQIVEVVLGVKIL